MVHKDSEEHKRRAPYHCVKFKVEFIPRIFFLVYRDTVIPYSSVPEPPGPSKEHVNLKSFEFDYECFRSVNQI